MYPIPRNKGEEKPWEKEMVVAVVALLRYQNDFKHLKIGRAKKKKYLHAESDKHLGRYSVGYYIIKTCNGFFEAYQKANSLFRQQENMVPGRDYNAKEWKKNMRSFEDMMVKETDYKIADRFLKLICERILLAEQSHLPWITPDTIHAAIAEAIIGEAGELFTREYWASYHWIGPSYL